MTRTMQGRVALVTGGGSGLGRATARRLAAGRLLEHPGWADGLPAAGLIEALAGAPAPENPLDVAPDQESRALLARALQGSDGGAERNGSGGEQPMEVQVVNALHTLERRYLERRQREIRMLLAEADRRGDEAMLLQLTREKMGLDRALREHDRALPPV